MKRLTVDTDMIFCDIARCMGHPGSKGSCPDGSCDQRRCYERLREYERTGLEPEEASQICRGAKTMMLETVGDFVRYSIANFEELQAYRSIGTKEELRGLKETEQKRLEIWNSAEIPPDQDGLYWGKKDNTNSMWSVRYSSGVWSLSAYPGTKMPITEWAYWDAFEGGESYDGD